MSEQRRLKKRLSDIQSRFNVVIDEIEKISTLSDVSETQLKMRDLHSRTSNLSGSRDTHKMHVRAVTVSDFFKGHDPDQQSEMLKQLLLDLSQDSDRSSVVSVLCSC